MRFAAATRSAPGLLALLLLVMCYLGCNSTRKSPLIQTQDILTVSGDNSRTGQNSSETILTPANVNSQTFGKLFVIPVDQQVHAQPLYVANVRINGSLHNVLIVATENDSVYAFDADDGSMLWHVFTLLPGETPSDDHNCPDEVSPLIGITATPVIDRKAGAQGTIYVVAMSKDATGKYFQRLHALDLVSGVEQPGGPREIRATFPGTGDNSSGGVVVFDPGQYKERTGLLLINGIIYTGWASHCDTRPYTGWLIAYDQNTLNQAAVLNFTPNGDSGALWNSGGGAAVDANGDIITITGNGTFDPTLDANNFPSQGDFGNSFLRISNQNGRLGVVDYFTPFNFAAENAIDEDLGSGGAIIIPDLTDASGKVRHLAVGSGKDGHIYVVDRDRMGKFNPAANNIYQEIVGELSGGEFGVPAYSQGVVYFGAIGDSLKAFPFSQALLASQPSSQTSTTFPYPGTNPVISGNGSSNRIVWAVENATVPVLHAYEATDLSRELYNSNQAGGRDQFGQNNTFVFPTVAHGKVYIGVVNGVGVFGLLNH